MKNPRRGPNTDDAQEPTPEVRADAYAELISASRGRTGAALIAWLMAICIEHHRERWRLAAEVERLTVERDALWVLLDDIDTLDDVAKGDDNLFRGHARQLHHRRHAIVEGAKVKHDSTVFPNPGGMQFNREPGSGCGDG